MPLEYRTRGQSSPQGKPRVYFCCCPEDFEWCFERIAAEILKLQNCAVWYEADKAFVPNGDRWEQLKDMQLFVMPVTSQLLLKENRGLEEFRFAGEQKIPVLPLMQEPELVERFNEVCGKLQFLDPFDRDSTAIPYGEKLKKFLNSVLVGDELAQQVREAFDAYVFLSYRKKDRKQAQELMRLIHSNDFCRDAAIWYDEFLVPGENFNQAIEEAMKKSRLFALNVTPSLLEDPNYIKSIEYPKAAKANLPILPVETQPTDRTALEGLYQDIPACVDAHNETELSQALLDSLRGIALREKKNDPKHTYFIGLAYLNGIDVEVDRDRGVKLITQAAEDGLPEAMERLAKLYGSGRNMKQSYKISIYWWEQLVEVRQTAYDQDVSVENGLLLADSLDYLGYALIPPIHGAYDLDGCSEEKALAIFLREADLCQRLLEIKETLEVWKRYIGSYFSCGLVGSFDSGARYEYYRKGLDVPVWVKNSKDISVVRNFINIYINLGRCIFDALNVSMEDCGLSLGDVIPGKGKNELITEGVEYIQEGIGYCLRAEETGEDEKGMLAFAYRTLAEHFEAVGRHKESTEYIKKCFAAYKTCMTAYLSEEEYHNLGRNIFLVILGMADIIPPEENMEHLIWYLDRCLPYVNASGSTAVSNLFLVSCCAELVRLSVKLDRPDLTEKYSCKALELLRIWLEDAKKDVTSTGLGTLGDIYRNMGKFTQNLGRLDEAKQFYLYSLQITEQFETMEPYLASYASNCYKRCYMYLADTCKKMGKHVETEEYLKKAASYHYDKHITLLPQWGYVRYKPAKKMGSP